MNETKTAPNLDVLDVTNPATLYVTMCQGYEALLLENPPTRSFSERDNPNGAGAARSAAKSAAKKDVARLLALCQRMKLFIGEEE